MSNGWTMTRPPPSAALDAVASASSTAKYTCQWFGTPGIGGSAQPPTSFPPTLSSVYF
jgi:hypothetical protein